MLHSPVFSAITGAICSGIVLWLSRLLRNHKRGHLP